MSASTLSVYLEFASYFPSRSGSEVVYLEQSYPRPKYFFPTVFAVQTVLFSFSSSNAVGMLLAVLCVDLLLYLWCTDSSSARAISIQTGQHGVYSMETQRCGDCIVHRCSIGSVAFCFEGVESADVLTYRLHSAVFQYEVVSTTVQCDRGGQTHCAHLVRSLAPCAKTS